MSKKEQGNRPLVSVVLANYNREKDLGECIRSVLGQTYEYLEFIIVDDASTDGSVSLIRSFEDERIRLICAEKGRQNYHARNLALKKARGVYAAVIDSDDAWKPEKLEKQVAFMEANPEFGACFTRIHLIDQDSAIADNTYPDIMRIFEARGNQSQKEWVRFFFEEGNCLAHPSALYRMSALDKVGRCYNIALVPAGDLELYTRIVREYPIHILDERLTLYRWGNEKITSIDEDGRRSFENVHMLIRMHYFDGMTSEQFIRFFGDRFVRKDSKSEDELTCEKLYILLEEGIKNADLYPAAIDSWFRALADEKMLKLLEEKYGFDLRQFYQNYKQRTIIPVRIQEQLINQQEQIRLSKQHITNLEQIRAQQERVIGEQQKGIVEQQNIIAEQQLIIAQQRGIIQGNERERIKREQDFENLSWIAGRYEQKAAAYDVMVQSLSWKMTRPVRAALDIVTGNPGTEPGKLELLREQAPTGMIAYRKLTQENLEEQRAARFGKNVMVSVLAEVCNTPEHHLREMIGSVLRQTYANWELCLVDGSDREHGYVERICRAFAKQDGRIRYKKTAQSEGVSARANQCIRMSRGEYLALLGQHDELTQDALYETVKRINEKEAVDVLYSDEDKLFYNEIACCEEVGEPHFKSDFNPELLRSCNYMGHLLVVSRDAVKKAGGFRKKYDNEQYGREYDFILRCVEQTVHIEHIARILYHWRVYASPAAAVPAGPSDPDSGQPSKQTSGQPSEQNSNRRSGGHSGRKSVRHPGKSVHEAGRKALEAHLKRTGTPYEKVETLEEPGLYRIRYPVNGEPLVSIIIPNRDEADMLRRCIRSVLEKSSYRNIEIIVIENNSVTKEIEACYSELEKDARIRIVRWKGTGFNYSVLNNFGAQYASGEYLLFLNNDTEVISPGWIEELLSMCQHREVGAAGAKLLYPDDTVQHGGVAVGLGGIAGHVFTGFPCDAPGYYGRAIVRQDLSAVTGACLMISAGLFDRIRGFDENLRVVFSDVDLCMKVREAGLLVVFNPEALLYHYESKTRRQEVTQEQLARLEGEARYFARKWPGILRAGDPYYNPNLTLERGDYSPKLEGEPDRSYVR